jgi:hypothetical protein
MVAENAMSMGDDELAGLLGHRQEDGGQQKGD